MADQWLAYFEMHAMGRHQSITLLMMHNVVLADRSLAKQSYVRFYPAADWYWCRYPWTLDGSWGSPWKSWGKDWRAEGDDNPRGRPTVSINLDPWHLPESEQPTKEHALAVMRPQRAALSCLMGYNVPNTAESWCMGCGVYPKGDLPSQKWRRVWMGEELFEGPPGATFGM